MNYTTLQADLAEYLDRSDLTSRIQEFIELGEKRVMHDIKFRGNETTNTATLTSGTRIIALPTRFRSAVHVERPDGTRLLYRTFPFIEEYTSKLTTSTGAPLYYTIYNDQMYVAPTADTNYMITINYYEEVEPLSVSNTSNYFTGNTPNLLLYASLLEAAPFLHNDERIQTWQNYYATFLSSMGADDSAYRTDEAVK